MIVLLDFANILVSIVRADSFSQSPITFLTDNFYIMQSLRNFNIRHMHEILEYLHFFISVV